MRFLSLFPASQRVLLQVEAIRQKESPRIFNFKTLSYDIEKHIAAEMFLSSKINSPSLITPGENQLRINQLILNNKKILMPYDDSSPF